MDAEDLIGEYGRIPARVRRLRRKLGGQEKSLRRACQDLAARARAGRNLLAMVETVISIRPARGSATKAEIARVHDEAWREAYRGVIPGRELERMIVRRGPAWWRRADRRRHAADRARLRRRHRRLRQLRPQPHAVAELQRRDLRALLSPPNTRAAASAGGCSRRRSAISPATAIRLLSCGRWPATTARSASIAGSAGVSCGGRHEHVRRQKRASASLSALVEPRFAAIGAARPAGRRFRRDHLGASPLNLQAVSIGKNAPDEVNVVIEVPIGGEPIKYEMDKASGALIVDRFLYTSMRYPGQLRLHPAHAVGRRRPVRRHRRQHARDRSRRDHELQDRRRADHGGRSRRRREAPRGAVGQADPALRAA